MRTLTLFIATSLDGRIAGPQGEIDWLFTDQDYGYAAFYESLDTVLLGRRTWDVSLGFGEDPFPGVRTIVFTRTARPKTRRAEFVTADIAEFVTALKSEPGKGIWLVGGGEIVAACARADLIDEYRIFAHPRILGDGIPLFPSPLPDRRLRFVASRAFDTGLTELHYRRSP